MYVYSETIKLQGIISLRQGCDSDVGSPPFIQTAYTDIRKNMGGMSPPFLIFL